MGIEHCGTINQRATGNERPDKLKERLEKIDLTEGRALRQYFVGG